MCGRHRAFVAGSTTAGYDAPVTDAREPIAPGAPRCPAGTVARVPARPRSRRAAPGRGSPHPPRPLPPGVRDAPPPGRGPRAAPSDGPAGGLAPALEERRDPARGPARGRRPRGADQLLQRRPRRGGGAHRARPGAPPGRRAHPPRRDPGLLLLGDPSRPICRSSNGRWTPSRSGCAGRSPTARTRPRREGDDGDTRAPADAAVLRHAAATRPGTERRANRPRQP